MNDNDIRFSLLRIEQKLDRVAQHLRVTEQEVLIMSAETDKAMADLTAEVAQTNEGIQSAVVLLNGIPALLAAQGVSPAQIAAVTATLKGGTDALLAAVAADGPQPAAPGPVVATPPAAT